LRISLLGGFQMLYQGQTLPSPTPAKLLSLLVFLLLHQNQPQARDQLAQKLWPDLPVSEARANLRRHAHLLRQALPEEGWLLSERDTLQWNPLTGLWLDVFEFQHFAKQAQLAAQTGQDPLPHCDNCLKLYTGSLMPELYDDWLEPLRTDLSVLYTEVLQIASRAEQESGNFSGALYYARLLLALDPLQEETHCLVMNLYVLSGDRAAALQQYAACVEILQRELGVEPMPTTRELYQQIQKGDLITQPKKTLISQQKPSFAHRQNTPTFSRRRVYALLGLLLLVLFTLGIFFLRPRAAQSVNLTISGPAAAEDTWITSDFPNDLFWPDDPDKTPHSRYSRAHLQYFGQSAKDRILIKFNLNQLPPNAQIEQALFEIHLETWIEQEGNGALTQAYPAQIGLFKVLHPWTADQATFNQPWSKSGLQPGLDRAEKPIETLPINDTAWLSFNVTPTVQDWVRLPDSNQGFLIQIIAAKEDMAHYWVDLTDQPAPNLRPFLEITYREP
jgi:DNA-binding SARP family transcriptional activator